MARTFIRQDNQVRQSDSYDDTIVPSLANYETNATSLEYDLNSIRSQLNNAMTGQSGSWYDDLNVPLTLDTGSKRGINDLNTDLHALERKRVLSMLSNLSDILVPNSPAVEPNYIDPVSPPVKPGATLAVPGTYATLAAAITAAADGDIIQVATGTYTLASTLTVDKQVEIVGMGAARSDVVIQTAATGSDPVNMIDVTVSNVTFKNLTLKQRKTTNTSIEAALTFSAGAGSSGHYVENCVIETMEFGVVIKSDGWQINNSHLAYVGPNNSTRRLVAIYRSDGQGLFTDCTYDSGQNGVITGNTRVITVTSTTGLPTEVLGGYLRISNVTPSNAYPVHQFMNVDWFGAGATPLELVIDNCTAAETSAFLVFFLANTQPPLTRCSSIGLADNTLTNAHGKGAIAIDGSSALTSPGTTTFYAGGNTLTGTAFIGNFVTALTGASVADSALMGRNQLAWSDSGQTLTAISAGGPQNWVVLGSGELPSVTTAAIGSVTTSGSVAAQASSFNDNCLDEVSGATAISPKNLVEIVDADTRDPILSDERIIYALFQTESGTDGSTIGTSTPNRVQLSFVRVNAAGSDLEAVPAADIAGKTINYANVVRKALIDLNEQDFLRGAAVDVPQTATVTRQVAYDNQGTTPVDLTTNATLDLEGAGLAWSIRDDLQANLFRVVEGSATGTSTVEVSADTDVLDVNAASNDFLNGAAFDTGAAGTTINVGVTANQIDAGGALKVTSGGAGDLNLASAASLNLTDSYRAGSTWSAANGIALAGSSTEWSNFETAFGEVSLLNAITQAKNTTVSPGGIANSVQINDGSGGFGGDANLLYDGQTLSILNGGPATAALQTVGKVLFQNALSETAIEFEPDLYSLNVRTGPSLDPSPGRNSVLEAGQLVVTEWTDSTFTTMTGSAGISPALLTLTEAANATTPSIISTDGSSSKPLNLSILDLQINNASGNLGEVLTSQGSGSAPIWTAIVGVKSKVYSVVTVATVAADTDVGGVGGGSNLDAQLPDMSGGDFLEDYDVFLNGQMLRPGANATANNDYYPGTSLPDGQLKFEFVLKANDVLSVVARA